MRKLTMALATTALIGYTGSALACPYASDKSVDISKPVTTAEAPISKPAQN